MDTVKIESIYLTLIGQMEEAFCVAGVENLFEEGRECDCAYNQMLDAYARLRDRLGVENEDADVEQIIDALRKIEKIISMKMLEYGMQFAGGCGRPSLR
ncbi:MAG: hypothetical protein E7470_07400 [Ruminococcaceae bacterium]|nr:hypothetical protein [Oscillospiraceae bacterium]